MRQSSRLARSRTSTNRAEREGVESKIFPPWYSQLPFMRTTSSYRVAWALHRFRDAPKRSDINFLPIGLPILVGTRTRFRRLLSTTLFGSKYLVQSTTAVAVSVAYFTHVPVHRTAVCLSPIVEQKCARLASSANLFSLQHEFSRVDVFHSIVPLRAYIYKTHVRSVVCGFYQINLEYVGFDVVRC